MKEYIDREAALACVCEDCSGQNGCNVPCVDYVRIKSLPAVDVVEVVRCKECKYGEKDGNEMYCLFDGASWHESDYYCSYGERKGGDE